MPILKIIGNFITAYAYGDNGGMVDVIKVVAMTTYMEKK